jgi:hypothetical protein
MQPRRVPSLLSGIKEYHLYNIRKEDPSTVTRQEMRISSLLPGKKRGIPTLLLQQVRKEILSLSLGKKGGSPHFHRVRYEYPSLLPGRKGGSSCGYHCYDVRKEGAPFLLPGKKEFTAAGKTNHFIRHHTCSFRRRGSLWHKDTKP